MIPAVCNRAASNNSHSAERFKFAVGAGNPLDKEEESQFHLNMRKGHVNVGKHINIYWWPWYLLVLWAHLIDVSV